MEGLLSAFIFVFILVSIWAFTTWRKLKNAENIKDWVGWSVCESNAVRGYLHLWEHLKNAQLHSNVSEQYRISGDEEWQAVKDALKRYQKELTQSYFDGRLWPLGNRYDISEKDYFIYMFYVYLCENENYGYGQHTVFRLYHNEVDHRNIVFNKMRYITYMYCKGNLTLQKNVPSWNEGVLKRALDEELSKSESN